MSIDNIRVGKERDRRIKLKEEDREYIRRLHKVEGKPIREIVRIFDGICSRRLIQFVLFPERLKENLKRRQERGGWRQYYTRDKRRREMRKYREHLKLIKKGL